MIHTSLTVLPWPGEAPRAPEAEPGPGRGLLLAAGGLGIGGTVTWATWPSLGPGVAVGLFGCVLGAAIGRTGRRGLGLAVGVAGLLALPWWPGAVVDPTTCALALTLGPAVAVGVAQARRRDLQQVSALALGSMIARALAFAAATSTSPTGALLVAVPLSLAAWGLFVGWRRAVAREHARRSALLEGLEVWGRVRDGAEAGLFHWDVAARTIQLSARAAAELGLAGAPPGSSPDLLSAVIPADRAAVAEAFTRFVTSEASTLDLRFRVWGPNGEARPYRLTARASRVDGRATHVAGSLVDSSSGHRNEAHLRETAYHDALTGLPNRVFILERLAHVFASRELSARQSFGVLFLDLDDFKMVNDSLGHRFGDAMLAEIARRLERSVRPSDTVARLGGDEFLVLLENLSSADEAEQVAARILARLRPVILVEGQELLTGASIGIALGPTGYTNPSDMIRDADTAMYQAKSSGKNKCCVFDQPMRERVLARISLERELQAAVDNQEFRLAFQPIVELAGGQLGGFEALIRWPRPGRSAIGPAEFIPVAEQTGLIVPISWWVIEEAATTLADWRARRPETRALWVQVNVNADVLRQPDFLEQLLAVLGRHDLPPQALRLEITEGAMLDDAPSTGATLARIREAGVRLYLDDFGTGYSSLSYLYRYRVDGLKIDRGFVTDLVDARQPGVVAAILQLAQCLGISVTAEGIENERQLAALQALGCPQGQGYYFSRAVDADEALELAVGREAWAEAR